MREEYVVITHIYGDRSISPLFCYHQDIESELYEIEMSISKLIFTHEKISKALWDKNIHTIHDGR